MLPQMVNRAVRRQFTRRSTRSLLTNMHAKIFTRERTTHLLSQRASYVQIRFPMRNGGEYWEAVGEIETVRLEIGKAE